MAKAPIQYISKYIEDPHELFTYFWYNLPWVRREDAPRRECWMNDFNKPYTYGRGAGERTYNPVEWDDRANIIQSKIYQDYGILLEGCFINGYEGPRDHLGWHSDDSPEINPEKPIAIISFGAPREIWFREIAIAGGQWGEVNRQLLESGSLLLMAPGMQQTHQHRIPKNPANCEPRVSLTYRGLFV